MGSALGCATGKVANDKQSVRNGQSTNRLRAGMSSKESIKDSHRFSLKLEMGDDSVSKKTLTFRHVMKDPLGREYFMKFLKIEHAEENLVFFEEVERFKANKPDDLKSAAEEIVATYLMSGVETEVNISDQMKRNLVAAATNDVVNHQQEFYNHLNKAQNEIMMILAMGAFPRFLKSKYFIQYKIKVKEAREKEDEEDYRAPESA